MTERKRGLDYDYWFFEGKPMTFRQGQAIILLLKGILKNKEME